ncbi:unnamed protein product [Leptosia nina]|uniref:PLD phosphodiesterase domain-containing protein n=1 Tax=Leptosia nina TaxID=320188 RepID=A0AAV1K257_9NEOP
MYTNEQNNESLFFGFLGIGVGVGSSPPPLSPSGRTNDDDAIVNIIHSAEEFVYISVMDYAPALEFTPKLKYWGKIDEAIRVAALERTVRVRLLISWWKHSSPAEEHYLRSLAALDHALPRVDIQVRRFIVPSTPDQDRIPFARVNHNKYMVTDKTAYIGTSNWSGDYFLDTAGVAFVYRPDTDEVKDASRNISRDIRRDLQDVFERDWTSPYAVPLRRL